EAQNMIAQRTSLDAPRSGKVGRDHSAERSTLIGAEQPCEVRRLEGKSLAMSGEKLFQLTATRTGFGRQHELLRLIKIQTSELRCVKHARQRQRAANAAHGPRPNNLEGRLVSKRRLYGLSHLLDLLRLELALQLEPRQVGKGHVSTMDVEPP